VAAASGAELRVLGENGSGIDFSHRFEASPEIGPHIKVNLSTPRSNFEHLPVPLRGEHQAFNCGLALAILDKLKDRGFEIREREVAKGLAGTPNYGRMEVIATSPRVVVDGAHNPESVHGLMRAIGAHMKYDSMVVIFGCAADKDVPGMLAKVALGADKIIFTKATGHARGVEPRELQRRFAEVSHKMAQIAPSVKDAIVMASHAVTRDDLICVTGSFYLAGEAKKLLLAAKKA
jgi:dihydrofolate synthase/folylpolyglutamate synthase